MKNWSVEHFTASNERSETFVHLIRLSAIGLMALFLMLFLVSCGTTQPTVVREVVFIYPPQSLTALTPTPSPGLQEARRNGELLIYAKTCGAALDMCNADKQRIADLATPAPTEGHWFDQMFDDKAETLPLKPVSESLLPGLMLPGKTPRS